MDLADSWSEFSMVPTPRTRVQGEPMLTSSTCKVREVTLERHQHEAVEATGTLEIHRVHDMRNVGGVLPLGMDEPLVRDDGESLELLSPAARSRAGEVAAASAHVRLCSMQTSCFVTTRKRWMYSSIRDAFSAVRSGPPNPEPTWAWSPSPTDEPRTSSPESPCGNSFHIRPSGVRQARFLVILMVRMISRFERRFSQGSVALSGPP